MTRKRHPRTAHEHKRAHEHHRPHHRGGKHKKK